MRILGRTERRVISAIFITALIPLVASILIARTVITRISATAFQPEFGAHLERALEVYADLAKSIKQGMRWEASSIASSRSLNASVSRPDRKGLDAELQRTLSEHPSLASLAVETGEGQILGKHERPVDASRERTFTVRHPLDEAPPGQDGEPLVLVATFTTPSARFSEMESAEAFRRSYKQFAEEHREQYLDRTYQSVFAALLGVTILLAIGAGIRVVRPVTNRIARLAKAMRPVAAGDLSVRVHDEGQDEVADLARAFDGMLQELERSRARIDFLRRMSEWQKMARRLAHEIKNPLTPIKLAVEECHRRYQGDDPAYRRLLQTMLEVVEEEVGTLRRLVGEFSSFARLPRAVLGDGDLGEFLREQADHFGVERGDEQAASGEAGLLGRVDLAFDIPDGPMPVVLDREMLHRVLYNIVENAAQALRDARGNVQPLGRVRVSVRKEGSFYAMDVDDDGPGISAQVKTTLFDPYVTTKKDGTGLGLSIVKKIVVDHGGSIDAGTSPLGGARFEILIPIAGTPEARAAVEQAAKESEDSVEGRMPGDEAVASASSG